LICVPFRTFSARQTGHTESTKRKKIKRLSNQTQTPTFMLYYYIFATLRKKKNREQKETSVKPTLLKINPSLSFSFSPLFHPLFTPWLPLSLSCTTTEKKDPREKEERGGEGQWVLICVLNSVPKPLLLGGRWRYQNNKNWNKMN